MEEHGKLEHDIEVEGEYRLHGLLLGNASVLPTGLLLLHGTINGDVIIAPGGEAKVHGTLNGDLMNQGTVFLSGVLNGRIQNNGGTVTIDPAAIINGVRQDDRVIE